MNAILSIAGNKLFGVLIVVISLVAMLCQPIIGAGSIQYAGVVFELMMAAGLLLIILSGETTETAYTKQLKRGSLKSAFVATQVTLVAAALAFRSVEISGSALLLISELGLLVYCFSFYGRLYFRTHPGNNRREHALLLALSASVLITLFATDFIL